MKSLVTAIRTLTILPVPGKDTDRLASTLPWFPWVGLLLGTLLTALAIGLSRLWPAWHAGTAVLLTVTGIVLTRALHVDGLSDWADGFWGGHTRERVLAIMKDSATGAFGATAIACLVLAKWVFFTGLLERGHTPWIIAAMVVSRTAQVDLAVAHPYARSDGGTGADFIGQANYRHWSTALLGTVLILLVISRLDMRWLGALALGLFLCRVLGWWAQRRIGGVTGDVLGAGSELIECAVLALGSLA